jgi:hypothetical protein
MSCPDGLSPIIEPLDKSFVDPFVEPIVDLRKRFAIGKVKRFSHAAASILLAAATLS